MDTWVASTFEWSHSVVSLCNPMDCCLPSFSVNGIFPRVLEEYSSTFQEYWSGLPFPSPEDLPDPGIEPGSPTMQADALTSEPPGKPPTFQLLQIIPQIWIYKSLSVGSFLWGMYSEVELLYQVLVLCLVFWGTTVLSSITDALLYIPFSHQSHGFWPPMANRVHPLWEQSC